MASLKNFFTNDRLLVPVLFIILALISVAQILVLRNVERTVRNTDLVAECTTPGTRCFKLTQERRAEEERIAQAERAAQQLFFTELITKANRCLIESAFKEGQAISGADRIQAYDECIARIPPIPPVQEEAPVEGE